MNICGKCCYGVMTGQNRMFCSAQNCFCEEVFYCEDYEPIVKPITNADRIRGMSDEELAKWIYDVSITDGFCPCLCDNTRELCITHNFECVPCITDWLKEEEGE